MNELFDSFPILAEGMSLCFKGYPILYILDKNKTLHFLNRNLTNLTQTHNFKKYTYIKSTRIARRPCKKRFKLYQAFMNNVEKRQTAFLSLEDYHYDILNM